RQQGETAGDTKIPRSSGPTKTITNSGVRSGGKRKAAYTTVTAVAGETRRGEAETHSSVAAAAVPTLSYSGGNLMDNGASQI
ncbi:hypothetical protein PIB30_092271, partial [Stylosanthes scabra]|nr:hypothetical protein [Stylosanthes scabra]